MGEDVAREGAATSVREAIAGPRGSSASTRQVAKVGERCAETPRRRIVS